MGERSPERPSERVAADLRRRLADVKAGPARPYGLSPSWPATTPRAAPPEHWIAAASHGLAEGPGFSTIQRHVRDGRRFRAVQVALEPRSLERSVRELGWVIDVKPLAGPFFPGLGGRAG
jgi:hypothetical protein